MYEAIAATNVIGKKRRESGVTIFVTVSSAVANFSQLERGTTPYQVIPNFVPDEFVENCPPQPDGPIVFVGDLRVDSLPRPHTTYLRAVAADIAALTKGAAVVTLVDPNDAAGDLGNLLPVRYQLLVGLRPGLAATVPAINLIAGSPPTHFVVDGAPPVDAETGLLPEHRQQDMAAVLGAPFVWYYDGGMSASALAGITLAPGSSYLLAHRDGTTEMVKSWPIAE